MTGGVEGDLSDRMMGPEGVMGLDDDEKDAGECGVLMGWIGWDDGDEPEGESVEGRRECLTCLVIVVER